MRTPSRVSPVNLRSLLFLAAASTLAPTALADRIYRTSGDPIEDVSIVGETLTEVTYQEERRERTIPSEEVLSIEFESFPSKVDEANDAAATEDTLLAIDLLEEYLEPLLNGRGDRRHPWAPAWAAFRVIELNTAVGELGAAISAGERLIETFPESRYVPSAYVAIAQAMALAGENDKAQRKLEEFDRLIVRNNLSKLWALECRLAKVTTSGETGAGARKELEGIEKDAGSEYPVVRNRAIVARGESYVAEVGPSGSDSVGALTSARELFEQVIEDPASDDATLAGAYAGLGSCIFNTAAASGDEEQLKAALRAFMRVVVLYKDHVQYLPRAMFYAGRCFNFLGGDGDDERANRLYGKLIRDFPDSNWAEQARSYRK